MTSPSSRRFYILTYPRTASNLLLRILNLEGQSSLLSNEKGGYFFIQTLRLKFKLARRHSHDWTQDEKAELSESYQKCFENLQKFAESAEAEGKAVFVKEHVPWLIEPVAGSKWVFGEDSTSELPWTVKTFPEQSRSFLNDTVLPDELLLSWLPTFLIRHPALVFPSSYRTILENEGLEVARTESELHTFEMTMHWSRTLYDFYAQNIKTSEPYLDHGVSWPIILDADDIMIEPEVVRRYSKIIGMDINKLRFSWEPASKEELDKMGNVQRRMLSTLSASAGIVQDKTSVDLDINEEAKKWKAEFGDDEGEKVERWVRAAMPDYEYMKAKRLRP